MSHIAIASQSYYPVVGGVTEHVHYQAMELLRRGHDVTVLTGPARFGEFGRDLVENFVAQGGMLHRIGSSRRVRWNGRTVTVVGEPALGSRLSQMDPHQFDLVHIHNPFEPFLPSACAHHFDAPMVGTFHTVGTRRGMRLLRPWLSRVANRLDARIAVSRSAREHVSRDYPGTYDVVPNGVDVTRFSSRTRVSSNATCRLLSVGRFDARKGIDVLLQAVDTLVEQNRDTRLEIQLIGSGPEQGRLVRYANQKGLPVEFSGTVSDAELILALSQADLFVAPATFGESFGIVLLEAMAAGLPIVASDIPGYHELTCSCSGVERTRPGDVGHLAATLLRLVEDPLRRGEMGRSNQEFVKSYSWASVVDRLEAIYSRLGVGAGVGVPSTAVR